MRQELQAVEEGDALVLNGLIYIERAGRNGSGDFYLYPRIEEDRIITAENQKFLNYINLDNVPFGFGSIRDLKFFTLGDSETLIIRQSQVDIIEDGQSLPHRQRIGSREPRLDEALRKLEEQKKIQFVDLAIKR